MLSELFCQELMSELHHLSLLLMRMIDFFSEMNGIFFVGISGTFLTKNSNWVTSFFD